MRTRKEILEDIISLNGDLESLQSELSNFSFDIDSPVITISRDKIYQVLSRFVAEDVDIIILENWANAIESREDLSFENESLKEIIEEFANPILYGKITKERIKELLGTFK